MEHLLDYGSSSSDEEDDKNKSVAAPTAAPAAARQPPASLKTKPPPTTRENIKGKKILSLQAVLPAHILAQLTQSQVRGGGGDDDDDEEEDEWTPNHHRKPDPSIQKSGTDAGIDSFLSDLHQSAPAATKPVLVSNSAGSNSAKHNSSSSKLGAAFLSTVTTTTTSHGADATNAVRDIHGESTSSVLQEKKEEQQKEMESKGAMKPPPAVKPFLNSVPRPSRATPASARTSITAAATPPSRETEESSTPRAMAASNNNNPKRRRQEMERLLRQGQWDAALSPSAATSATVLEMDQPKVFQPTDGAAQNVDTMGLVRMAATSMYDPSQGQAVVGKDAGRGKNQINHLLASAANLELARARGMAAKPGQNSHRANAKRKYGW